MARKFQLGQAMATMPIVELCRFGLDLGPYFERHVSGDWGDVQPAQKKANDASINNTTKDTIRSCYTANINGVDRRFWIVTAGDRSRTIVMLPSDSAE